MYRIDDLVKQQPGQNNNNNNNKIDILKIHTNGNEDKVLRGAAKLLEWQWKIPTVILHSAEWNVLHRAHGHLSGLGYEVTAEGTVLNGTDAKDWFCE